MILSYKYKFIFIHCRKVAGSSIKSYFNPFLGPSDIQIGGWDEAIENEGKFNKRFLKDILHPVAFINMFKRFIVKKEKPKRVSSMDKKKFFLSSLNTLHRERYNSYFPPRSIFPKPEQIIDFDKKAWNKFFKFCFVRNPYEKAVSDYIWRVETRKINISFFEFLRRIYNSKIPDKEEVVPVCPDNWPMYTINDKIVVDFIGRYENFEKDFKEVCNIINIPYISERMPLKKKFKNYNYQNYYGDKEKKMVGKIYSKEIEFFGYRF